LIVRSYKVNALSSDVISIARLVPRARSASSARAPIVW
jgi:hypothetical protein